MIEDPRGVFDAWLAEAQKCGLQWEVLVDLAEAFFEHDPEKCLEALNGSMMDWDM